MPLWAWPTGSSISSTTTGIAGLNDATFTMRKRSLHVAHRQARSSRASAVRWFGEDGRPERHGELGRAARRAVTRRRASARPVRRTHKPRHLARARRLSAGPVLGRGCRSTRVPGTAPDPARRDISGKAGTGPVHVGRADRARPARTPFPDGCCRSVRTAARRGPGRAHGLASW
jgi:hypothetical protein